MLLPPLSPSFTISSSPYRRFKFKPRCLSTSPQSTSTDTGVIVIGAGLSGLAAATHLNSNNIPFLLLDSSDAVGGRVRTDIVDGFLLDRGFQIFITAYPEARKLLNYNALDLRKFYSGAKVYYNGQFCTVADPLRHLADAVLSLANPIGSVFDKLLIGSTRAGALIQSDEQIMNASEVPTIVFLKSVGFSDYVIDRFFRPFFGGIFFDTELETSSRLFNFVFKCLALGDNTLPASGIGEIPNQLAGKLPQDSIMLNTKVLAIDLAEGDSPIVRLENGQVLTSQFGVVVAVEQPEVDKLFAKSGKKPVKVNNKPARSTVCLYFTADQSQIPVQDPVLFLNGSGKGIVNNMFFATNVAPSYSQFGKALISVSLIGLFEDKSNNELVDEVIREISGWFKSSMVESWRHLRTYRIPFAQPNQSPPTNLSKDPKFEQGVYLCGDYLTSATFDGALVSGRRAVEALIKDKT
ncbi:hypothetical protein ACFE04_029336 [Oxalis oulophora]